MTEALGQSTTWTGNGDKSGLDGAGDTFVDGDFLGVVKKFHFFAIRILNKNRISSPTQAIQFQRVLTGYELKCANKFPLAGS